MRFLHSKGDERLISIPAIGLDLAVRVPSGATDGSATALETIDAPGFGPPLHRHRETKIFRILEGSYLFDVDGRRFQAEKGDVVNVPGGAAHAFVNVTALPARQFVLFVPGLDAVRFFKGLADVMRNGSPHQDLLNAFGRNWGVEFLGPPLALVG
ncbi:MAG TPA: cupin domain-containing protein [Beijerinckia sp.]|jgi:quercetin dioxygenase-like cupin family protein|nr:cupin domain-containing protein [Beijerinckia sp.]